MILFIIWIVLSIVAGAIASDKGRSGVGFFFLSLIFSPLVGIPVAIIIQPDKAHLEIQKMESGQNKKCPFCAELIKKEAKVCRYCGRDLPVDNVTQV